MQVQNALNVMILQIPKNMLVLVSYNAYNVALQLNIVKLVLMTME